MLTTLITGAIVGYTILYDVKAYLSKIEFMEDSEKHFAAEKRYSCDGYRHAFLVTEAKTLKKPIPYLGKSAFFDVDYFSFDFKLE